MLGAPAIININADKLERKQYAENIAKGILNWNSKESLCMALSDPRGYGKTSIINLCLQIIRDKAESLEVSKRPRVGQIFCWRKGNTYALYISKKSVSQAVSTSPRT